MAGGTIRGRIYRWNENQRSMVCATSSKPIFEGRHQSDSGFRNVRLEDHGIRSMGDEDEGCLTDCTIPLVVPWKRIENTWKPEVEVKKGMGQEIQSDSTSQRLGAYSLGRCEAQVMGRSLGHWEPVPSHAGRLRVMGLSKWEEVSPSVQKECR